MKISNFVVFTYHQQQKIQKKNIGRDKQNSNYAKNLHEAKYF